MTPTPPLALTPAERQHLIAKGAILLRPPPTPLPMKLARVDYERQRREGLRSAGLNSCGEKPKYKSHPELKGLIGKEYHRAYMRLWREK